MADLQETVGAVVRRERRMRRLTLRDVAGRAALSLVLERLAAALGLAVSELLELIAGDVRAAEREPVRAIGSVLPMQHPATSRATIESEVELRAA